MGKYVINQKILKNTRHWTTEWPEQVVFVWEICGTQLCIVVHCPAKWATDAPVFANINNQLKLQKSGRAERRASMTERVMRFKTCITFSRSV